MKGEFFMKKRMLFVLLAVCLVLGLCLGLAACKKDEPAAGTGVQEVELYWNVEAKEYLGGTLTRMAQEDGTVMMIFSKDGEQVRLPVKDYYLAVKLDLWGVAGLVFDENGVVVDALRVEECTGGYIANKCVVTEIQGTTVTCNTSGLMDGREIVFELPEGTPVWNIAGSGITVGIPWTVGVDDQIIAIANEDGSVKAIHCTADLEAKNGNPLDGRKIKGTIHWVSAKHAVDINVMHYDKLFTIANLNDIPEGKGYNDFLNPDSLVKVTTCKAEPAIADAKDGERFQFVRTGYYVKDTKYENTFNRIVTLKDSYKPQA